MIEIIPYFTVYVSSAVRFFLGPALGIGFGLGIGPTILLTTAGMMSTVFFITFFSHIIQIFIQYFFSIKKNKKFTSRTRKFIKIWKYSGVKGIAFITPIVLSPVIGAILLNAVGAKKKEIIKWMLLSALLWASIESALFYFLGNSWSMLTSIIE
jgi:hypothetical protein